MSHNTESFIYNKMELGFENQEKHFKCEPCGVAFVKLTGLKQHRKSDVCHALGRFSICCVLIGRERNPISIDLKFFLSLR